MHRINDPQLSLAKIWLIRIIEWTYPMLGYFRLGQEPSWSQAIRKGVLAVFLLPIIMLLFNSWFIASMARVPFLTFFVPHVLHSPLTRASLMRDTFLSSVYFTAVLMGYVISFTSDVFLERYNRFGRNVRRYTLKSSILVGVKYGLVGWQSCLTCLGMGVLVLLLFRSLRVPRTLCLWALFCWMLIVAAATLMLGIMAISRKYHKAVVVPPENRG